MGAVPSYQSSKSYTKATVMTFIASLAQPFGGLVGYIFLVLLGLGRPTEFAYGAIFSITAGVMVAISLVSLLPEALAMSTPAFCMAFVSLGFLAMEISIILLQAGGGHSHAA